MEGPTTATRAHDERISLVVPVHTAVPGRARFSVAGLYGGPALKEFLEGTLRAVPEVRGVTANVLTGDVLVLFDRSESVWDIRALVEEVVRSARGRIATAAHRRGSGAEVPGGRSAFSAPPRCSRRSPAESWRRRSPASCCSTPASATR